MEAMRLSPRTYWYPTLTVLRLPTCCSTSALAWREYAFWMCWSIVVRFTSVTSGTGAPRIAGNAGALDWVGERLMFVWRRALMSSVLPADNSALATARSGMRSKNSPAPPRTTVRWVDAGDQAKPKRGDTLFVSVAMVSSICTS